jgi:hypothetical protein
MHTVRPINPETNAFIEHARGIPRHFNVISHVVADEIRQDFSRVNTRAHTAGAIIVSVFALGGGVVSSANAQEVNVVPPPAGGAETVNDNVLEAMDRVYGEVRTLSEQRKPDEFYREIEPSAVLHDINVFSGYQPVFSLASTKSRNPKEMQLRMVYKSTAAKPTFGMLSIKSIFDAPDPMKDVEYEEPTRAFEYLVSSDFVSTNTKKITPLVRTKKGRFIPVAKPTNIQQEPVFEMQPADAIPESSRLNGYQKPNEYAVNHEKLVPVKVGVELTKRLRDALKERPVYFRVTERWSPRSTMGEMKAGATKGRATDTFGPFMLNKPRLRKNALRETYKASVY